ncbi:hypothetical protein Tco_0321914 [Tanacetum coccineum]
MDNIRAQQKALDDELVAPANRLKIGKSNLRLSSNLKSKESTLQVALDALKLTPFYKAFEISADVPEIYMQEDMLKICLKLPGQIFEEPPLEEEILSFIKDLGHTSEIKANKDDLQALACQKQASGVISSSKASLSSNIAEGFEGLPRVLGVSEVGVELRVSFCLVEQLIEVENDKEGSGNGGKNVYVQLGFLTPVLRLAVYRAPPGCVEGWGS